MYLVQLLLPLSDNEKKPFPPALFVQVERELTRRFGGVTAHLRAPAHGMWRAENGGTDHDRITLFEVMTDELDRTWWAAYRQTLEHRFRQEKIVVRAMAAEEL